MIRENFKFKYFFDTGYNKKTGECDVEGVDVYEIDLNDSEHFIAEIPYVTPNDIEDMTDEEFEEFCAENGLF